MTTRGACWVRTGRNERGDGRPRVQLRQRWPDHGRVDPRGNDAFDYNDAGEVLECQWAERHGILRVRRGRRPRGPHRRGRTVDLWLHQGPSQFGHRRCHRHPRVVALQCRRRPDQYRLRSGRVRSYGFDALVEQKSEVLKTRREAPSHRSPTATTRRTLVSKDAASVRRGQHYTYHHLSGDVLDRRRGAHPLRVGRPAPHMKATRSNVRRAQPAARRRHHHVRLRRARHAEVAHQGKDDHGDVVRRLDRLLADLADLHVRLAGPGRHGGEPTMAYVGLLGEAVKAGVETYGLSSTTRSEHRQRCRAAPDAATTTATWSVDSVRPTRRWGCSRTRSPTPLWRPALIDGDQSASASRGDGPTPPRAR